jgi:hypothetical protein
MPRRRKFSPRQVREYLNTAENGTTPQERGRALENLVREVFLSVPSIDLYTQNALDYADAGEIDLIFINNTTKGNGFYFLSTVIVVESKNWQQPVGSEEVRVFIDRLRERACDFGVLVAAHGITGNAMQLTAAQNHISRALESGTHVLVVTREELARLGTVEDIVELFKKKLLMLKAFRTSFGQ